MPSDPLTDAARALLDAWPDGPCPLCCQPDHTVYCPLVALRDAVVVARNLGPTVANKAPADSHRYGTHAQPEDGEQADSGPQVGGTSPVPEVSTQERPAVGGSGRRGGDGVPVVRSPGVADPVARAALAAASPPAPADDDTPDLWLVEDASGTPGYHSISDGTYHVLAPTSIAGMVAGLLNGDPGADDA